ncbi:MAG: hypothetical protein AAF517_24000, partial [Planctomycetota bacterium]
MRHRNFVLAMFCLLLLLSSVTRASAQEGGGGASPGRYAESWVGNDYHVPICFVTPGFEEHKRIIRDAILETWDRASGLRFTFTEGCSAEGGARFLTIRISNGAGFSGASGVGMAQTLVRPGPDAAVRLAVDDLEDE